MACFRLLCLAHFFPVWYLHQILLPAGIIHDNHFHPMAFISMLRGARMYWVLRLAEFQFVWYLYQLLQCERTIRDNFISPTVFVWMFQDAWRLFDCYVWLRSIPVWYLHQILQREGITQDNFMCRIAFILVLLDAYHVFDCCVCQPCVGLHYITLHSQHSQWISSYISASKWLFSHCIALHCVAFHYITVHYYIPLHRATLHYIALRYTTLHYIHNTHDTQGEWFLLHMRVDMRQPGRKWNPGWTQRGLNAWEHHGQIQRQLAS